MIKLSGPIFLFLLAVPFVGCKTTSHKMGKEIKAMKLSDNAKKDVSGEDILLRCEDHLKMAENLKNQLIKNGNTADFNEILAIYNDILVELDAVMSQSSLISQVHPNDKIRKDAEQCEQKGSSFVTDFSLNSNVYEALKRGENLALEPDTKRFVERTLRDFRRSGVDKDEETRKKIKQLKEELVTIGQEFGQNIRDDRFVILLDSVNDLKGMPQDYIAAHKPNSDGKIEISTDYPDYIPFMKYAESDKYRKELRFKYLNRGQKNGPVLQKMIEKRYELAKLLGYRSYADYVASDKMIKSADEIHKFIEKITTIAKDGADKEYQALLDFKRTRIPGATEVEGQESGFLEDAYKKQKFGFDAQEARSYFSYNKVRDGLLNVTGKLFGVRYEPIKDIKLWHDSVEAYDVFDESGKLGRIYLDMHPREGKYKHAAQFTVLSGLKDRQYPEGTLVCNMPDPRDGDGSALMEHREVVTMFHEFGHLLHHIFAGKQRWMSFSGVATEWDFVEAPSQLLEEWAWAPEVLAMFATNAQNQVIPVELVQKMRAAEEFGKALSTRQQMFYAALSVNYFDRDPSSFDKLALLEQLQQRYSYYKYEPGTHFDYGFGHLEGYSAIYYTYMWSLSIAKDLLVPFKRMGLMNTEVATRYRDTILKAGGSKDAADLVSEFLGRPFSFDAFEAWLKTGAIAFSRS